MTCDRSAQIHALHDGELPAAQREAALAHVAVCEPCAELLAELRSLSRLLAEVPLPTEADAAPMSRYYGAFNKAQGQQQQRGILRLSGWLTAAAAAIVIAATLFRAPPEPANPQSVASANALPLWQTQSVMLAPEGERDNGELVVMAQWMADDLAAGGR